MKIGVIRFSSIGDIILCTPLLRWLRENITEAEIIFLTKKSFTNLLKGNPNVDKVLAWDDEEGKHVWKSLPFDFIIDLHNNLRSRRVLLSHWFVPVSRLDKQNIRKALMVVFRNSSLFKCTPITDRIMNTICSLGDCRSFTPTLDYFNFSEPKKVQIPKTYGIIVLGGSFKTKQIPESKIIEIINKGNNNWVLIGGAQDVETATNVVSQCESVKEVVNLVGQISIPESAYLIQRANIVISSDTGMYHIAVALGKQVAVFWGNTVPEMGMLAPVKGIGNVWHYEVGNLGCRPCSKLGFDNCPKGHFRCMMDQNIHPLFVEIEKILEST